MTNKQKVVQHIINNINDDITDAYEHLMDGEEEQGLEALKEAKKKIKELEDNFTKKDKE